MKSSLIWGIAGICVSAAMVQAQPSIAAGGVFNAASYVYTGLPNSAIAQGSLFVVFGSNMGPAALAQATYPLPTALAGTSLTAVVNGATVKPYLVYTSAGQLAALMPSNTPIGTGTLTVTFNGTTSATVPIQVVANSVGIFAVNQKGSGPGIITNTAFKVSGLTNAANPGEANIIWATGVAAAIGDEASGTATVMPGVNVQVYVGGKTASLIAYARAPGFSGLDQIAFTVPAGVTGCNVPVAVVAGNIVSNFVSMSIAATGRVCSDPASPGDLSGLLSKGNVSTGTIVLGRSAISIAAPPPLGNITTTSDSGSGSFSKYTAAQYTASQNPFLLNTFGACTVFTFKGSTNTFTDPVTPTGLDAGAAISVTGPNGAKQMTKQASVPGFYSGTFASGGIPGLPGGGTPYLDKGSYTITGPGGADVGAFNVTLNLPDPLVWSNAASISTVVRSQSLDITWTGGDPAGNVDIIGFSTTSGTNAVGAAFVCIAPASALRFTIPNVVLLSLPASAPADITSGSFGGILGVGYSTAPKSFTASGLDQAYVLATGNTLKTVNYQ